MDVKNAKEVFVTLGADGSIVQETCKGKSTDSREKKKERCAFSTVHSSHALTIVFALLVLACGVTITLEIRAIKIELTVQQTINKNQQRQINLLTETLKRFQEEEKKDGEQGPTFVTEDEVKNIQLKNEKEPSRARRSIREEAIINEVMASRKGERRKKRCGKAKTWKKKFQALMMTSNQSTEIMHMHGNNKNIATVKNKRTVFKNWQPAFDSVGENVWIDGWIHIQTAGYYYVYCQVTYQGTYPSATYGVSLEKSEGYSARGAFAVPINNKKLTDREFIERTKYIGRLMKLTKGQKISVVTHKVDNEAIIYAMKKDSNFFGAFMVSKAN